MSAALRAFFVVWDLDKRASIFQWLCKLFLCARFGVYSFCCSDSSMRALLCREFNFVESRFLKRDAKWFICARLSGSGDIFTNTTILFSLSMLYSLS